MDEMKKEKIALLRFQVIAALLGLRKGDWGKKEKLLQEITQKEWEIPYSARSYIGRSTVLEWLKSYEDSGGRLESLYPKQRTDRGLSRSMDIDTEKTLINLKKELKGATLPTILKIAQERKLLPVDFNVSSKSIYRMFKRYGLDKEEGPKKDRRRFEAELPNDMWQSDCMHGPKVDVDGKLRKSFLFAFIDDHSRLIPHAQFYLRENLESFLDCLLKALEKRGLPRKLYVDHGPSYRAHHLAHITASLGIALIHCKAYSPEQKGKIERWFKTVRMSFLPSLPEKLTLEGLNERLWEWIDKDYHLKVHSSIKQGPLEKYLRHITLIRPAPKNLLDYFRKKVVRTVYKDRTVSILSKVYEAPLGLIDKRVTLLYHESDPGRIEVQYNGKSYGFLVELDPHINSRIRRSRSKTAEIDPSAPESTEEGDSQDSTKYKSGKLFEREEKNDQL